MQQPYGKYPYYGAPVYPPQTPYMPPGPVPGPSNAYAPFYGPPNPQPPQAPHHPNPPAPTPYSFNPDAYLAKPDNNNHSQNKIHHRRTSTAPGFNAKQPLKSAMKKTMDVFSSNSNQLTRQKSNPPAPQALPTQRQRVYSNPSAPLTQPFTPDDDVTPSYYMLVSFHGYNELRIENVMGRALEELRTSIWTLWPPGVESDIVAGNHCTVRFHQAPWDLNGPNAKYTYRLITAFFQLFQTRGYSFQATVSIAQPAPRLIFRVTSPSKTTFFIAYFSSDHRRLTVVNPPSHIEITIGARLRSAFPKKSLTDTPSEDEGRIIELRKNPGTGMPDVDPIMFYVEFLNVLRALGFELDAAIMLGRRNALGIRVPRELLVFRSTGTPAQ